ncbi:MAG: hypothetical protein JWM21_4340 [Acidobacteria bacterium]|nr:hypothetical protein [Acidobacteriota bacterium]
MNSHKLPRLIKYCIAISVLIVAAFGILVVDRGQAKNQRGEMRRGDKVAPDLRNDVHKKQNRGQDDLVKVIVQFNAAPSNEAKALLRRNGIKVKALFQNFNAQAVELPASAVDELAAFEEVEVVSRDAEVKSFGHVSLTTGADAVRGNGAQTNGLDGTGIGIAVVDSGIDTGHVSFLDKNGISRIAVSRDFTGENRVDDPYGHGTHVASIAAGNGRIANASYLGIAPNAKIINLRVLNSQGAGSISAVLNALDWVMTNRTTYNIRIVNMSLGSPAVQSYKFDPVCLAVRRVVDAGIVVTVAAGNVGKDALGRKIYGAIHSPGIEPSALTVGATNTFGTATRADDTVTTYSSRGPTRSYWTDSAGVHHFDNLVKPDLVAPGNKLVYAESDRNLLVTLHPQLDAGIAQVDNRREMYLNGTSMSTPVVAGAAALMLQANPSLTPNLIKAILTYTAQPLAGVNKYEQGAGELNIEGAVRIARLVRTNLGSSTVVGAPLLTTTVQPTPQSTIAGYTFNWSGKVNLSSAFASGTDFITRYQRIYATGVLVGDGVIVSDGVLVGDHTLLSDGVLVGDGVLVNDGVLVGDGVIVSDGVIVGDGVLVADGVIVSDGVIVADLNLQAQSGTIEGDVTPAMSLEYDTGLDCLDY